MTKEAPVSSSPVELLKDDQANLAGQIEGLQASIEGNESAFAAGDRAARDRLRADRRRLLELEADYRRTVGDLAVAKVDEANMRRLTRGLGEAEAAQGVGAREKRLELARRLDKAANAFLEALTDLRTFSDEAQRHICAAGEATRELGFPTSEVYPGNAAREVARLDSSEFARATVIWLSKALWNFEAPHAIATLSPGWYFNPAEPRPTTAFADVAQRQNVAIATYMEPIMRHVACAKPPARLAERA